MEQVLVSVVVPVYRTQAYLDRCIESIVGQTHGNLQILLIDDGSSDDCPRICDAWAARDGRIQVIHQQNRGLGMARNAGIDAARGKYICFFDSDDYVAPEAVAVSCELAQTRRAELVLFGHCCVDERGNIFAKKIPQLPQTVYEGAQVQKRLLPAALGPDPRTGEDACLTLSAWSCLISMELIRRVNWKFVSEREVLSEDVYALVDLLAHVRRVAILPKSLYFYCENENSLSRSFLPDRYARNKQFYKSLLALCAKHGFDETVCARCAEPYLRNTICAMKQVAAQKRDGLEAIVWDPVLQQVLRERRGCRENLKKRLLWFAVRRRWTWLCHGLLMAKMIGKRICEHESNVDR